MNIRISKTTEYNVLLVYPLLGGRCPPSGSRTIALISKAQACFPASSNTTHDPAELSEGQLAECTVSHTLAAVKRLISRCKTNCLQLTGCYIGISAAQALALIYSRCLRYTDGVFMAFEELRNNIKETAWATLVALEAWQFCSLLTSQDEICDLGYCHSITNCDAI